MKSLKQGIKVLLLILVLLPLKGFCTVEISPPVMHLETLVKENDTLPWTKRIYFFKGTVIGYTLHVKTGSPFPAINIKIHEYWSEQVLNLPSDTLAIMTEMSLIPDSTYLFLLKFKDGLFRTDFLSGTNLFSKYSSQVKTLGQGHIPQKAEPPKRTKEERKSQLILWLVVSLALNFFAILLIVLLKKEKH